MATSEQPQTQNTSNIKDIPQERWYIMDDETKQPMGPYSRWIIVSRFNNNQIEKETLLWLDGTPSGWKQLCEFGELKDVLPNGVINDNAIIEFDINNEINLGDSKNNLKLTKDNLENKLWYYKNEWSKIIGPIPLSEVFYKLETNVIGRNTEIQEENSQLWRRVEDVQKQFAKEWHENEKSNGNENSNNDNDNGNENRNEEEEDFDLSLSKNPDFFNPDTRYLAELEHQFQKEEKQLTNNGNNNNDTKNENDKNPNEKKKNADTNTNKSDNDKKTENENSNDTNEDTNGADSSKTDNNNNNKANGKRKRNNKNKHKQKNKTSIYISGLPLDIDTSELFEYFHEAGIIKKNGLTGEMMIKIYHNHETMKPKGDALITFLKQESVKIAIDRFDDSEIRPNHTIRVKAATFEQESSNHNNNSNSNNNNNNTSNSNSNDDMPPKKRQRMNNDNSKNNNNSNNRGLTTTQKDILSKMNNQESLLSWDDDDNAQVPQLSIVILKNMFDINDIYNEPYNGNEYLFYQNLKKEVIDECVKKIGKIEKCDIYQGSRKGVIKIKFEYPKHAAECIKIMNRRYFDGRIIECSYWDGTDYTVRESMEQQEQRLKQFQKQIEE